MAWSALSAHKSIHMQSHAISQCQRYNTHWVPFRSVHRYFISVLLSPLAAHFILLAGAPHFGFAQLANANCLCRTSISQSIAKLRLHSSAAFVHFVKFTSAASYGAGIAAPSSQLSCQPLVGARSCFRSFLSPAASYRLVSNPQYRHKWQLRLRFFFAVGVF